MTFFIPISALRFATSFLVALFWILIQWKWWPRPEDAKGWQRWTYIVSLCMIRVIYTLTILFNIFEIFPLPD